MKKSLLVVLFAMLAVTGFAEKVGELPEVMRPSMITVYGNELYIGEGAVFSVYSLEDLAVLRQFGKKGEGPGELLEIPHYPNKITVLKDEVFVTGIGKAISFTREGTFRKEFRTHQRVVQLIPVGNNFVAKEQGTAEDGKTAIMMINLYSPEMKKIKELCRQKWPQQGSGTALTLHMEMDFISIAVVDDKIFIEESSKGFFIEVFDSNGRKLYEIEKDYEKLALTSGDKNHLIDMIRNDPAVRDDIKRLGGWNEFRKIFKLEFPEHLPAIKGIEIAGNKLYVRTYKAKGEKEEYLVMNLDGKVIKTLYLPRKLETGIYAQIAGGKLFSISGDNLYYIIENEDEELWELHVESL